MLPVMLIEVRAALLVPLLLLKYIQCPWFRWQGQGAQLCGGRQRLDIALPLLNP